MVHGIISCAICFNYYICEGIFSVAYGVLYKWTLLTVFHCYVRFTSAESPSCIVLYIHLYIQPEDGS